jgi:hypothetical protein
VHDDDDGDEVVVAFSPPSFSQPAYCTSRYAAHFLPEKIGFFSSKSPIQTAHTSYTLPPLAPPALLPFRFAGKGKEPERAVCEADVSVVADVAGQDWMTFAHPRHLCRLVPFTAGWAHPGWHSRVVTPGGCHTGCHQLDVF